MIQKYRAECFLCIFLLGSNHVTNTWDCQDLHVFGGGGQGWSLKDNKKILHSDRNKFHTNKFFDKIKFMCAISQVSIENHIVQQYIKTKILLRLTFFLQKVCRLETAIWTLNIYLYTYSNVGTWKRWLHFATDNWKPDKVVTAWRAQKNMKKTDK